jgi:zinc transport system permease protein
MSVWCGMTGVLHRGKKVIEFFTALSRYTFLQYAVIMACLASIACGIVGAYVVTRRITYLGGAIAHSVLGGMGAAYYLMVVYKWNALQPLYGAVITALIAALIIGLAALKARGREDSVIGAVWAVGMAVGIIFVSATPGYNQDLMSYLFGNILMVTSHDLWLIGILDILVVLLGLGFYRQLTAVCFDEEFARVRGVKATFFYLLLLAMTALTIVILITVVGIILVIALLTLPAAIAAMGFRRMGSIMLWAVIISVVYSVVGLAVSYTLDFPAGATIILLLGVKFIFAFGLRMVLGRG